MLKATQEQRTRAMDAVDHTFPGGTYLNSGEVFTVLDALANEEDARDALDEYRFWRSPAGGREERTQLWESGHPLSDVISLPR